MKLKTNGKSRGSPVADAAMVEISWLCPGRAATELKRKGAETGCRMLGGDLCLVDKIQLQGRHARVAGIAEEEFLLPGNPGNCNQVAWPELPYTLEQLQQMQAAAAAAAIAASKADIQQSTTMLYEFPMASRTHYIELKG